MQLQLTVLVVQLQEVFHSVVNKVLRTPSSLLVGRRWRRQVKVIEINFV